MGGGHLLHVYNSSCAYRMKRLTAYIPMSVKRYSEGKKFHDNEAHRGQEERAPSIAEEFRRAAEEKTRQGVASSQDVSEEMTAGDSDSEPVKEIFKEPPGDAGVRETSTG